MAASGCALCFASLRRMIVERRQPVPNEVEPFAAPLDQGADCSWAQCTGRQVFSRSFPAAVATEWLAP